jgi:hypothetical protein
METITLSTSYQSTGSPFVVQDLNVVVCRLLVMRLSNLTEWCFCAVSVMKKNLIHEQDSAHQVLFLLRSAQHWSRPFAIHCTPNNVAPLRDARKTGRLQKYYDHLTIVGGVQIRQ